jgi:hypothetical protein
MRTSDDISIETRRRLACCKGILPLKTAPPERYQSRRARGPRVDGGSLDQSLLDDVPQPPPEFRPHHHEWKVSDLAGLDSRRRPDISSSVPNPPGLTTQASECSTSSPPRTNTRPKGTQGAR